MSGDLASQSSVTDERVNAQDLKGKNMHVFSTEDEPLPYPGWWTQGDYSWLFEQAF